MRYKIAFLCFFSIIANSSCKTTPKPVIDIIDSSNQNRQELEKVISHYERLGDSEKLNAVYFLIENLPYHNHFQGTGINNYKILFNELVKTPDFKKEELDSIWDSLVKGYGKGFPGQIYPVEDITMLKSRYLINHIESAFHAWNYPWARNLQFKEFCEYILPYKLVKEEPFEWNKTIQNDSKFLSASLDSCNDTYDACLIINDLIKKNFKIRSAPFPWEVTFKELDKIKSGKCYHATQYTSYIMRSFGIPVTMDFTPLWANMNGGHEWNALIYNGKPIPYVGSESDPGKTKLDLAFQRKRGKIYRHMFSIQKDALEVTEGDEDVPVFFKNPHLKDVTEEYIPVTNIHLKLNVNSYFSKYAYLCVFNRKKWRPLAIGTLNGHNAYFPKMGRGIVYLPMYYESGILEPAGDPILLEGDGNWKSIILNKSSLINIKVHKKGPAGPAIKVGNEYELLYWDREWVSFHKKVAKDDFISFENTPSSGLYWVRSLDKSSNERIFTVENEQQEWW